MNTTALSQVMSNCILFSKVQSDHPSVKPAEDLIIYGQITSGRVDYQWQS